MTFTLYSPQEICRQLAARCKTLRLARNMPQRELADKAGMSFGTIRRFERGESISLENFVRILEALGHAGDMLNILDRNSGLTIRKLEELEKSMLRRRAAPGKS